MPATDLLPHIMNFSGACGCADQHPRRYAHDLGDGTRQWIESSFDTFRGPLGLEHYGACTTQGLLVQIGAKFFAMTARIWRNSKTAAPYERSLIDYDR